ncbi:hypothetical protein COO60DRAFT_1496192, partial [Scenedesmus sp. NREL 46B-D3]
HRSLICMHAVLRSHTVQVLFVWVVSGRTSQSLQGATDSHIEMAFRVRIPDCTVCTCCPDVNVRHTCMYRLWQCLCRRLVVYLAQSKGFAL